MSGLMGAIGRGLSAAGYAAGEMYAKGALLEAQSEMEMERAKRLAEFKAQLEESTANRMREQQTARIDAKAGQLADEQIAPKRGLIEAGITDRSTWTAEQQAAVDQSLGEERRQAKGKLRVDAAVDTGDISPKDAASIEYKNEALVYKALLDQEREAGKDRRQERQLDAQSENLEKRLAAQAEASDKRLAYLFKALEQRGRKDAGEDTAKEVLRFLDGSRKEIASDAQNLRQLYQAQIKDKSRAEVARIDAEYKPKFEEIDRKRAQIEEDYNSVRTRVGLPAAGGKPAATPAPAPKPAAGPTAKPLTTLPKGSRQIGTSGGKPVYETPDGKRFIGQ